MSLPPLCYANPKNCFKFRNCTSWTNLNENAARKMLESLEIFCWSAICIQVRGPNTVNKEATLPVGRVVGHTWHSTGEFYRYWGYFLCIHQNVSYFASSSPLSIGNHISFILWIASESPVCVTTSSLNVALLSICQDLFITMYFLTKWFIFF